MDDCVKAKSLLVAVFEFNYDMIGNTLDGSTEFMLKKMEISLIL
jgi:hypothetical protein